MSAVETESPPPATSPAKATSRGILLPVILAAVLSSAMAAGVVWFVAGRHSVSPSETGEAGPAHGEAAHAAHGAEPAAAAAKKAAAQYLSLSPAFTVNLAEPDASHFLQIDMEVMSRDAAALDAVKANMPQIRNALLLLLGQLKLGDVATRDNKEALQKHVVEEIQKVLTAETGKPGIDSVYFTSFVVQ
jgi:flagellar FliL protein